MGEPWKSMDWSGVPLPRRAPLTGRYVQLEPLDPARHTDGLYDVSVAPGAEERFRYLPEVPPSSFAEVASWVERAAASADPLFFAVVDQVTGRTLGRQAMMRMDPANGVIEIGNILWGPQLSRTRGATEALFLVADHVFSLGYRRFEWKCNDLNEPSKRAARRFGFSSEGVFRQHMVIKGANRDTAWFSIIDGEWPALRAAYADWLAPENFDADGVQRTPLVTR